MADTLANPLITALVGVCRRTKAIAVVNGPEDRKELEDFRKANGNARLYIVHPKVKVADGDLIRNVPMSGYVAGVFAANDFWESPSNKVVNGILGLSVPISFEIDDPESDAQQLNGIQVATIVREDGGSLVWGAKGSGDPTDSTLAQIQKVRIADAIEEAITASTRWAVAAGIVEGFEDSVAQRVNEFFENLVTLGAIRGGKCEPDLEKNTAAVLARGDVFWKYEFTPISVAETLHFEGFNTNKYYEAA